MKIPTLFGLVAWLTDLVFGQSVVINEIGWMGTSHAAEDEWIELYNTTDDSIDLRDWKLQALDGTPSIVLTGSISAQGFYLLERTDETTISDCAASQIYTGAMSNSGEYLQLRDHNQVLIDSVDCHAGWFAGSANPKVSMERIHPKLDGTQASSWLSNTTLTCNGLDAQGSSLVATPGQPNSVYDPSLPVELTSFNARWHHGAVLLEWIALRRLEDQGYSVLRQDDDNGSFSCISDLLPATGLAHERQNYFFLDERVKPNHHYCYQLQGWDLSGQSRILGTISIYTRDRDPFVESENHLQSYPNPFNPGVTLQLELANPAVVQGKVYDVLGQQLSTLLSRRRLLPGMHQFYWDGTLATGKPAAAGLYLVHFWTEDGQSLVHRLVKCR